MIFVEPYWKAGKIILEESVADISLIGISSTGQEFPIEIVIGKPRLYEGDWICAVIVTELDSVSRNIFGVDALQSLTLALKYVAFQLSSFVEAGGQLLDAQDHQNFPLSAYFPA